VLHQLINVIYENYKLNLIAIDKQYSKWGMINQGVRHGCSLLSLIFAIYINESITQWRPTGMSSIPISINLKLGTLLFADDQVVMAYQRMSCNVSNATYKTWKEIFIRENTKINGFSRKISHSLQICIHSKITGHQLF
jgi:hypothetical protein